MPETAHSLSLKIEGIVEMFRPKTWEETHSWIIDFSPGRPVSGLICYLNIDKRRGRSYNSGSQNPFVLVVSVFTLMQTRVT